MIAERSTIDSISFSLTIALRKRVDTLESKKKYIEALNLVGKMVDQKLRQGLAKSFQREIGYRIRAANRQAVELLCKGKHEIAIELLKKAKSLAKVIQDDKEKIVLKSLIYNSIACVYREKLEVKFAQYYVEKAISLAKLTGTNENLSIIYLNGAAIYSQAKEQLQSKVCAENAIQLLSKEIAGLRGAGDIKRLDEKKALLTFAYFTLGQQELKLNDVQNAYQNLILARRIIATNIEPSSTLKQKINQEIKKLEEILQPKAKGTPSKRIVSIKHSNTRASSSSYSSVSTRNMKSSKEIHRRVCSNYNNLLSANYPSGRNSEQKIKMRTPSVTGKDIHPLMLDRNKITKKSNIKRLSTPKVEYEELCFKSERRSAPKYEQEMLSERLLAKNDEEVKEINMLSDSESNSIIQSIINSDIKSLCQLDNFNEDNIVYFPNKKADDDPLKIESTTKKLENNERRKISIQKRKVIKIFSNQIDLEPKKVKVIKIQGEEANEKKTNEKPIEDKQSDTHPKILPKLNKDNFINSESPGSLPNITVRQYDKNQSLISESKLERKPSLEKKSPEIAKSTFTRAASHFFSSTNMNVYKSDDIVLQDNYDPDKEKLNELIDKAIKIQVVYKAYRERQQYKQRKEHRKVLAFKGFYALAKNTSIRTIITIYIVQETDVELMFTDYKTLDIVYRWKGKCDCPLNTEIIKLCWEEIVKESQGNSGNDSKELVKRMQTTKYKDIGFHIEDQESFNNENSGPNIEMQNDNANNILVTAIKETNNSICKVLPDNTSALNTTYTPISEPKPDSKREINSKISHSITSEHTLETKPFVLPKTDKKFDSALEVKLNLEEKGAVPIEKKNTLINPNFERHKKSPIVINSTRRQQTMVQGNLKEMSGISLLSKRTIRKECISVNISMPSIAESVSNLDEIMAAIKIQRWYKIILFRDRVIFKIKDLYKVIKRKIVKLCVEYNECSGEEKEIYVRIIHAKKEEVIELMAMSKKTYRRYKSTFVLKQGISNNEIKTLYAHVSLVY